LDRNNISERSNSTEISVNNTSERSYSTEVSVNTISLSVPHTKIDNSVKIENIKITNIEPRATLNVIWTFNGLHTLRNLSIVIKRTVYPELKTKT
jgi:hypothetical protein